MNVLMALRFVVVGSLESLLDPSFERVVETVKRER